MESRISGCKEESHGLDQVVEYEEIYLALKAKTYAEVILRVLNERLQRMERHLVVEKEQVELYMNLEKEQIALVISPMFNKIKELGGQV